MANDRQIGQRRADPLLQKLAAIRASGDRQLIEIVTRAIESAYGILRHGLTDDDIRRLAAAQRRQKRHDDQHRET